MLIDTFLYNRILCFNKEKYKLEDEENMKKMEAKFVLVDYMQRVKDMLCSDELNYLSPGHKKKIEVAIRKVRHWLEENPDELAECQQYEDKRDMLENTYDRITAKYT
ncbi:hypothetical protein ACLB2K_043460 [Fragaria x ananassa]